MVAGDSVIFTKTVSGYAASDGWVLTYSFITPSGDQQFSFRATASGSDFAVSVPPATTVAWQAATYSGQARAVGLSGETHVVWQGILTITPDLGGIPADNRSHAKIVLDNIEAVLEKKATREILNSEINGVRLDRIPVEQLLVLRDRYRIEYRNEINALKIAQGMGTGRRILTRFTPQGGQSTTWINKPWQ